MNLKPSLDRACLLLLAVAAFALYAATAVPGPFDGDSGEFQYMPRLLGLPHPTGYPLYLLLGWLWSWLPLGTLAFRLNLFSAFWAALTLAFLFLAARQQGMARVAALAGALALALVPPFWRYAGLAAVYTLHTALLAGALWLWLRWSAAHRRGAKATRELWLAAFATGLTLTNHPTAAFLVPAVALFALLHLARPPRPPWRDLLGGAALFALPGLLYLYVPLRLWSIGAGNESFGVAESIARGYIAPFLDWTPTSVLEYITGRSLLVSYAVQWSLLATRLPGLLAQQFSVPLVGLAAIGALLWLRRWPRSWLMLAALFVPAAAYAATYDAEFAARNQIAHLEGHLMPAFVVFALWLAMGTHEAITALARLTGRARGAEGAVALLLVLLLASPLRGRALPTAADRVQSQSIRTYWTEVLAYPLESGAALTGHWGDLTAFWYFQHGEAMRPDLWAIFPPTVAQIDKWLATSGRPLYLAGPLLDGAPELLDRYNLTPWGILVRIAPPDSPPDFPPMTARSVLFGEQVQLDGYQVVAPAPGRRQLWLSWHTIAPTSRDLAVSLRLHAPDGTQLLQKDGRLASLWFPEGTMAADQPLLTVFDIELPADMPPDTVARVVVYDPQTVLPLLSAEGQDVVEVGPIGK